MADFIHTKTEPARLADTADNIESGIGKMEQAFRVIDDTLQNLFASGWEGDASTEFLRRYAADKQSFDTYISAMKDINRQLRACAGIFDAAGNRAEELAGILPNG